MNELGTDTGGTSQRRGVYGDPWRQQQKHQTVLCNPSMGTHVGCGHVVLTPINADDVRLRPVPSYGYPWSVVDVLGLSAICGVIVGFVLTLLAA